MGLLAFRWHLCAGIFALFFTSFSVVAEASEGAIIDEIDIPPGMSAGFVRDEQDVSIIDFDGEFGRYDEDAEPNAVARAVIAREFFQDHADDYDFLFFFSLFDYEMGDAVAFHLGVRNDVEGIGKPIYDNSERYGSDGRLLGTIDMGPVILDETKTDPTSDFHELLINTTMHEMLHQWGVFVSFIDPETGEKSSALLGKQDAHWSPLVHTGGSVEYGAKWLDNQDGTFTAIAERLFYSPMDLYLMGMAAPNEVPPFFLIENSDPALDPKGVSALGSTVAGRRKNLRVEDIIAAEGPREPSWEKSQKSFNAAFVLVKRPGQEVPPEVYGRINTLRKNVAQRFSILTGGRGLMHVYSRVKPLSSVGENEAAAGDAGDREGVYRLADALIWLRDAQSSEGNWHDTDATSLRDSFLAHRVLSDLDPLYIDAARQAFTAWLGSIAPADNDGLARIATGSGSRAPAAVQALLDSQRLDGGWGLTDRHESDPLDTALVVNALRVRAGDSDAVAQGIGYLLATQNGNGGWPAVSGGDSQIGVTAQVVRSLRDYPQVQGVREAASNWLGSLQSNDGSFGAGADRVADTARALTALADAGRMDSVNSEKAIAYLQGHQGANGSWNNSVFNTAAAVRAMGRVQHGNWSLTDLRASTDTLYDGQRLSLIATIVNDGNIPTPSTTVALYLGDPNNGGVLIDTVTLPNIGIGQGVEVVFDWDSFGQSGDRELYVVVDPDDALEERTDLDNSVDLPVTVTPPSDGVDLVAGGISMTPSTITTIPTTAGFSALIRNVGQQSVEDALVQWWVDESGASTLLGQERISLAGRGDTLVSTSYQWETPGERTFRVTLDPESLLEEVAKDNNSSTLTVLPEMGLDLVVGPNDIELMNTPAYGQTLNARVRVRNQGTVASPSFTTEVFLEDTDGHRIDLNSVSMSLDAGAVQVLDVPWRVDRVGDFNLVVRIDPEQQVADISRGNNEARRSLQARIIEGVNLKVNHETLSFQPQPLLEGFGAVLKARVENTGTQPAGNVRVSFFDGKPGAGGILVDEISLPVVEPAGSVVVEGVWDVIAGSGERVIYVVADSGDQLEEFDETDNSAFRATNVESLPDLALSEGAVTLSPPLVAGGEAFTATVKVVNLGHQKTEPFSVAVYWDSVSEQNRIAEKTVASSGLSESELTFNLIAEGIGERKLHIVLDSNQEVVEQDEQNNSIGRRVVIQSGSFYIDNPYISPNGDGELDTVDVVFRLDYPEGSRLVVESESGQVLRNLALDTGANGSVTWDGRNDLGGVVADGSYTLSLKVGNVSLSEAPVVVDNNRSPLTGALIDEQRGYLRNLTCDWANSPMSSSRWALSEDEETLFFDKTDEEYYPGLADGIYGASLFARAPRQLAALENFHDADRMRFLAVNRAADRVVFGVSENFSAIDIYEKTLDDDAPATLLMSFSDAEVSDVVYGVDDRTVFLLAESISVILYNATTGTELDRFALTANTFSSHNASLHANPDHSRILVNVASDDYYPERQVITLLNTQNQTTSEVTDYSGLDPLPASPPQAAGAAEAFFCPEGQECENAPLYSSMEAVWSPDGARFAVGAGEGSVLIYDADGSRLESYALKRLASGSARVFSSLTWSSDSSHLAFFHGGRQACCDSYPVHGGYLYHLDLASGESEALYPFFWRSIPSLMSTADTQAAQENPLTGDETLGQPGELLWLPSDDALLHIAPGHNGHNYVIPTSGAPQYVREDISSAQDVRLSPRRRSLLFTQTPPEDTCNLSEWDTEVSQLYVLDTLDNLTVDLRILRSSEASGFEISGTVTDLHFDHFTLMYSENGVDGWRPIRPNGANRYVDDFITTWVPSEPGRYFVRLSGYDKAGNSLKAVRQVAWGDAAPVSDIYVDQDQFSPNGDGVNDSVGVHFKVREPVNLTVRVYQGDTLIRTFDGAYDQIGQDIWVQWDGRDENGQLVPDGEYRVDVHSAEYVVNVDNTPPELSINMADTRLASVCVEGKSFEPVNARDFSKPKTCGESYKGHKTFLGLDYGLTVRLGKADQGLPVAIEYSALQESAWTPLGEFHDRYTWLPLDEAQVTNRKFRASVRDAAGNQRVVEYRPAHTNIATLMRAGPFKPDENQANLMGEEFNTFGEPIPFESSQLGPIDHIAGNGHFTLSETIADPIIAVYAEHANVTSEVWSRHEVTRFLEAEWAKCRRSPKNCEPAVISHIPDGRIHLLWDMAVLSDVKSRLRFVLLTSAGEEITTPEVRVNTVPIEIEGFSYSKLGDRVVAGKINLASEMSRLDIYLQSDEDGRYRDEQLLGSSPPSPTTPVTQNVHKFSIDATDTMACRKYTIKGVLTLGNGAQHTQTITATRPCLKSLYRIDYPDNLGEHGGSGNLTLTVWPVTLDQSSLKSLEVFAPLAGQMRDTIATATRPSNGAPVEFSLDVASWPVGVIELGLRLVDESGLEDITRFKVYKDTDSPAIEMAYPPPGESICGRQPLQLSYVDTIGPAGSAGPDGWSHERSVYGRINRGAADQNPETGAVPGRLGKSVLPYNLSVLAAQNITLPANHSFWSKLVQNGANLKRRDLFPEFQIEVLDLNGANLQSIPLWDQLSTPDQWTRQPQAVDDRLVYRESAVLPWALPENGDASRSVVLKITGSDAYGNHSVLERELNVDAVAPPPTIDVDDGTGRQGSGATVYISPNGDGVLDGLGVTLASAEPGALEVRLYTSAIETNTDAEPVGVIYRNKAALQGELAFQWDGNLDGLPVPDGSYRLVPVLVDACGNVSEITYTVSPRIVVDTQAPGLSDIQPPAGAPIALFGRLSAAVSDPHIDRQRLGVSYRAAGAGGEVPLTYDLRSIENGAAERLNADWNTYGLAGAYEIVWWASDLAGNETLQTVPVSLLQKADMLSSLQLDHLYVSPNGDGHRDVLRYHLGVLEPVTATVTLQTASGMEIADVHSGDFGPGSHTLYWGDDATAGLVGDGGYRLKVTARSIEFPSLVQSAEREFIVDTRAPMIQSPSIQDGFLRMPFDLRVAIEDDAMREYRVVLQSEAGIEVLAEGERGLPETRLRTLADAPEGEYRLKVEAHDLADNLTVIDQVFTLDRTDPELYWEAPSRSLLGGERAEAFTWSLGVEEAHPGTLQVLLIPEGGEPVSLHEGEPVSGVVEGQVNIGELDGRYALVATLSDLAGNDTWAEKSLVIDRSPPVVSFQEPIDGAYLTTDYSVSADAQEDNPERWTLKLKDAESGLITELDAGGGAVGGLLGTYPVPEDGEYKLLLQVNDAVGYQSEAYSNVVVDTIPPEAPTSLTSQPLGGLNWRLTWNASSSPDVDHYQILDNGQPLGETVTSTSFEFQAVPDRAHQFAVVAVDQAGLESEPSVPLSWRLDISAPSLDLQRPLAGARVGGLVDVIGTAYADDLASYTLEAAAEATPNNWNVIASAGLSRQAERLGQWNTLDGGEDGNYQLRLRAVDHEGNAASTAVIVSVDNTAPQAPTGLQALEESGDVTVTWGASPSLDVAGYLLTRNGDIANAEGPVVGGITPYLMESGPYLDADVVDGHHRYNLYAVDHSGNMSEPAGVDITLDRRAPVLDWVRPAPGEAFEHGLILLVDSPDEDLASVQFRYRATADSNWTELSPDRSNPPYLYDWNTRFLPHGDYQVQAQTRDEGGRVALSEIRTVRKQDLTPPLAPSDLIVRVMGEDVMLTWTPSGSEDVATHRLTLINEDGETMEGGNAPTPDVIMTVPGLDDGTYQFELRAFDQAGNESGDAARAEALIFTPQLDDVDPLITDAEVSVAGHMMAGSTAELTRIEDSGLVPVASISLDAEKKFEFKNLPLSDGHNQFVVTGLYGEENVSKAAPVSFVKAAVPGKIRDLERDESKESGEQQVALTWRPPADSPDAYYLVRDQDGQVLSESAVVAPISYEASASASSYYSLENAFDSDLDTQFLVYVRDWTIEAVYEPGTWIAGLHLRWGWGKPETVRVLGKIGEVWRELARTTGQELKDEHWVIEPETPWPVNELRLQTSGADGVGLVEWTTLATEIGQETDFLYRGTVREEKTFTVSAITHYGVEGEGESLTARTGDWTAPEAVALSAIAQGNEALLEWAPSVSGDADAYLIYRHGQMLDHVESPGSSVTVYRDGPLANGVHPYQVRPLDAAGNLGAYSNLASVTISAEPPQPPGNVESAPDPLSGCIELSWQTSPGALHYQVLRAVNSGPYERIATVTGTDYTDCDVYPQVDYGYRIVAVDEAGNDGDPSSETPAIGAEDDTPPPAPVILQPVPEGGHYEANDDTVTIGGHAEQGTTVVLSRNGYPVTAAMALDGESNEPQRYQQRDIWAFRLSPGGGHLAVLGDDGTTNIVEWPSAELLLNLRPFSFLAWIDDDRFATLRNSDVGFVIETGTAEDQSLRELTTLPYRDPVNIREWYYQPGLEKLVLVAERFFTGIVEVLLVDPETGSQNLVYTGSASEAQVIKLAPSGQSLLWGRDQIFHRYDRDQKLSTQLPCEGRAVGWSAAPEKPILWGPQGIAICADDGYQPPLMPIPEGLLGVNAGPGLPEGILFLFWQQGAQPGRAEVKAFDRQDVIAIGEIAYDSAKEPFVEGVLQDNRPWFTYRDQGDPDVLSVEVAAQPINFTFPNTLLNPGMNRFSVFARDRFGNEGEPSGDVLIDGETTSFANLAATLEVPKAAASGYSIPIAVTVANTGNTDLAATNISVMVFEGDGSRRLLSEKPVTATEAGDIQTWHLDWSPVSAGTATIEVEVDPKRTLHEARTTDNRAVAQVPVTGEQALSLILPETPVAGKPGDTGYVDWMLVNPGVETYQGELILAALTPSGNRIQELTRVALPELSASNSRSGRLMFKVPNLLPGQYRLRLEFIGPEPGQPVYGEVAMQVEQDLRLQGVLSGTSTHFGAHQEVVVDVVLSHVGTSGILSSARWAVRVQSSDGETLANWEEPLSTLMPGDRQRRSFSWNTGAEPPGDYHFHFALRDGMNTLLLEQAYDFTIDGTVPMVSGELKPASDAVGRGRLLNAGWSIQNSGNIALPAMQLVIEARREGQPPVALWSGDAALSVGAATGGELSLSTAQLGLGAWRLVLAARITLNGAVYEEVLATRGLQVRDIDPPELSVLSPEDGAIINSANALLIARASDAVSALAGVQWRADHGAWNDMSLYGNEYRAALHALAEGLHTLEVTAFDDAGNRSLPVSVSVTVDNTPPDQEPPEVTIDGVEDGGYYGGPVTLRIEIEDASPLAVSEILLDGAPYSSGTAVESEGAHRLEVTAEDEAGNRSHRESSFVIDTGAPVVRITGVEEGGQYATPVTPVITIEDVSPVETMLLLNKQPYSEGTPIEAEGDYRLEVRASDPLANDASTAVTFSLDFTAPQAPAIHYPLPQERLLGPDIEIRGESDPGVRVELALSGFDHQVWTDSQGEFSWLVALDSGPHILQARAMDDAGNRSPLTSVPFEVLDTEIVIETGTPSGQGEVLLWRLGWPSDHPPVGYPAMLENLGIPATVVNHEADFKEALASERYRLVLLVGAGSYLGGPFTIGNDTLMRLRGAVASGYGLVWIDTRPELLETWRDLMGARGVLPLSRLESVEYSVNDQDTLALEYQGPAVAVRPLRGEGEGQLKPYCYLGLPFLCPGMGPGVPPYPAAVLNEYGRGITKLLAFDPRDLPAPVVAETILADLIRDVAPSAMSALHYVPEPAGLTISRDRAGLPLTVTVSTSEGLLLLPSGEGQSLSASDARWEMAADALSQRFDYRLLAEQPGNHEVLVTVMEADTERVLEEHAYPFEVDGSDQELIESLRQSIEAEIAEHSWNFLLYEVRYFFEASAAFYRGGDYGEAHEKLYWAMFKLRLISDYNENLMALMGDYQRLLIRRKKEF